MKKTAKSLGYSVDGLKEAWQQEKNLRTFVLLHVALTLAAVLFTDLFSVIALNFAAAFFVIVELLNTALERLADTFDDCEKTSKGGHYHPGVKMTKDVAAAASLVALTVYGSIVLLIVLPYILIPFYGLSEL
jgi:diacylglycerol kinase